MRVLYMALLAGAAAVPVSAVYAAEALKFGPAPSWVVPKAIPETKPTDSPVAVLLNDQQTTFEVGKIATYSEIALRVQNPEGLSAGNISLNWQPATDTVTINKLHIRRDGKVIDVLASGQTFTVLRRETNLDAAMLDGTLTGNIQPEGLQEGDIIDLATTTETVDPVMKGHVETTFADWNGSPIELGHLTLSWPAGMKVNVRQSAGVPAPRKTSRNGRTVAELSVEKIEPMILPNGAPARFRLGRVGEATDFASWADLSNLMLPLFQAAETIPATGPLHDEVEKIRAATTDPKQRAEMALALVENRVRYVALLMGQGGYVPASAETTWSRRFGDCKAKTALMLGILHSLGIAADPVLVNTSSGDSIAERLPMVGLFDHVIVRARIGGKDYWLDETRTSDSSLDNLEVPNFGWGLPLTPKAALVRIVPPPRSIPDLETRVAIDATAGIHSSAPVTVEQIARGDGAIAFNSGLNSITAAQRQEFFKTYWKKVFDSVTMRSATFRFDKARAELTLVMTGDAKLDWSSGWYHIENSAVGYKPDFDRTAGPGSDAPIAVDFPSYSRIVTTIKMPSGFFAANPLSAPAVNETLAGVEYRRSASATGDVLTVESSERSLVPEVAYKDATAAATRLRALAEDDVSLRMPASYRPTQKDAQAIIDNAPATVSGLIDRASTLMDSGRFDEAIADLTKAIALDPRNSIALADRGLAYVWKEDYSAAEKDLAAAAAIDPNESVVFRARGLIAEQKSDYDAAISAYTRSLESEPGNGFSLGHRARVYRQLGDYDKALTDSDQALKLLPDWTDLRLMRATILTLQGKREGAAAEATTLIRESPGSSFAIVAAARIYTRVGMRTEAMQAFDKALALKPEAFIYLNRAQSRPATDFAGRRDDLDAALKLEPDNVDVIAEEARLYATAGDYKRSLTLYDRLVNPSAAFSEYAVERATVLYKAGRQAEAQRIFAEQRPKAKTAQHYNSLCWAKATAGIELDSALSDCQESLRLKPDSGPTIDSLAFVKLRQGKIDEAISLYTQAIAKRTGSASYMGRAIAYSRKGDKAHSQADLNEALKLDPDAETRFAEYGMKL